MSSSPREGLSKPVREVVRGRALVQDRGVVRREADVVEVLGRQEAEVLERPDLLGAEEPGAVDARLADAGVSADIVGAEARRCSPGRPQPPLNVRETAGRVIDQSNIC